MTTPLQDAWTALATCAMAIRPVTVPGEPENSDARKVADDLDLIESKFSAMVEAYGEAMAATFNGYDPDYTTGCIEAIHSGFSMMRGELLRVGEELERAKYEESEHA